MKLTKYLKDKFFELLLITFFYIIIIMMLLVFKVPKPLKIAITLVFFVMIILIYLIDFLKKKKFYKEFITNLSHLDKKYLILETISKPNFYEGEILYQGLYETNKSMLENISLKVHEIEDFKDYIEMWIHEVKIPISSLTLLCHNHQDKINKAYLNQIRRLDNYIDQVLYYVRSNYTEEDFIIKEVELDKVISKVLLKNKDDILENKINLEVNTQNEVVFTDQKWLDFILNQIINNSIKYKKNNCLSYIKITIKKEKTKTILIVYDNGIGIPKEDLPNVFKKSFTGTNGQYKTKSTGMGLYIVNKLCKKLGHDLEISSVKNKYTEVRIIFGSNDFYKEIK